MRRVVGALAIASLATACGGASEERVSALEARLAQLSHGGSGAAAPADERLAAIEQQLSVVQREVANGEEARANAPVPLTVNPVAPAAPAPRGSMLEAITWSYADALLGADVSGVTANGDGYTVQRVWLAREIAALRLPGRAPKLTPGPFGVVIRLVKPRSFAAQLGLQNADVITAIDDHPVSSTADVASALHAARGGQTKVKVLRKKRELQLDYKLID